MALHPEVDSAIEDIVNEAIVSDSNDVPVEIELSNLNASDGIKKKIRDEFKNILDMLDFDKKSHEIYRNWYIDGRLYYHKVIDLKNPQEGIQELRYIDALKMRYVRQQRKDKKNDGLVRRNPNDETFVFPEIDEYFIYNSKGNNSATSQLNNTSSGVFAAVNATTISASNFLPKKRCIVSASSSFGRSSLSSNRLTTPRAP